MAVDDVVAEPSRLLEGKETGNELRYVFVEGLLCLVVRAGLQMHDSSAFAEFDDLRVLGVVLPGENIGVKAKAAQLASQVEQVYIHPAGVSLSQASHRAAMEAQKRNPIH